MSHMSPLSDVWITAGPTCTLWLLARTEEWVTERGLFNHCTFPFSSVCLQPIKRLYALMDQAGPAAAWLKLEGDFQKPGVSQWWITQNVHSDFTSAIEATFCGNLKSCYSQSLSVGGSIAMLVNPSLLMPEQRNWAGLLKYLGRNAVNSLNLISVTFPDGLHQHLSRPVLGGRTGQLRRYPSSTLSSSVALD